MSVVLALNERTKSYSLFCETSDTRYSLNLKYLEDESKETLSAGIAKILKNSEFNLKPLAKFETALGFLRHKSSKMTFILASYF